MATWLSRLIGFIVLAGLASYGGLCLAGDVLLWQDAYERTRRLRLPSPEAL